MPQKSPRKTLIILSALALLLLLFGSGCASTRPQRASAPRGIPAVAQTGTASYYANKFDGRRTASGERYDKNRLTAAHPTAPFGTIVRVTHLRNHKSVVVRVNDRGPFVRGRIIDLSSAAARRLDMIRSGTAPVKLEIIEKPALSTKR